MIQDAARERQLLMQLDKLQKEFDNFEREQEMRLRNSRFQLVSTMLIQLISQVGFITVAYTPIRLRGRIVHCILSEHQSV